MPLIRIDLVASDDPTRGRSIADAVQTALVETYGIPEKDDFKIITEHPAGQIVAQDAGLGFDRSDRIVMIQIFTQQGRSQDAKQQLYSAITTRLGALDVGPEDVFISCIENTPADWSFGFGRAQYLTGELDVPDAG